MADPEKVLQNLLNFYKKRDSETYGSKFISAASDLVSEGDIEESVFMKFCDKNGIDVPKSVKKSKIKPFDGFNSSRDRGYSASWC